MSDRGDDDAARWAVLAHVMLEQVTTAKGAVDLAGTPEHAEDRATLLAVAADHLEQLADRLHRLARGAPLNELDIDLRSLFDPSRRVEDVRRDL